MNKETIIQLTNKVREGHSLNILSHNDLLEQSAQHRAEEICSTGNWSHDNWKESLVYDYRKAGENLAKNYQDEKATVDAWVNSPKHYENIVGEYTETGIGVKECGENTYIVQHFASPIPVIQQNNTEASYILPLLAIVTLCIGFLVVKWVHTHLRNENNTTRAK